MSGMKHFRPLPSLFRMAAIVALAWLGAPGPALAQVEMPPPAPGASRGENFSAKPPAALFQSDCTGAGCHKGPQGLAKGIGFGSLAGFLREHYTNSRESAAALANYLSKIPSGPEPREARTPKPSPSESRSSRTSPSARSSRAAARSDDDPPATPPAAGVRRSAEPSEATPAKQSPSARAQRGRHPVEAAVPLPQPEPPPAPPKKQYDIFD